MSHTQVHAHQHRRGHLFLTPVVQMLLVLAIVGILLYTVLFSDAGLHNTVHDLRHSLGIIPCH